MSIAEGIDKIKNHLPSDCNLVAVSKTKPVSDIIEAYEHGHRHFGENKVQELVSKYEECPKDIHWHMIGHLQRNKVKYIAPFVYLIHGVDSLRLLREINKQASKNNRTIDCLLQIHIAKEESKFGFDPDELDDTLMNEIQALENIRIKGLMGMATFTDNASQIREEFKGLKKRFDQLASSELPENMDMQILSTGMSNDYPVATEEGSNMVRVGSLIFGERND